MATLEDLYATLTARKRPEDVAQMIQEILAKRLSANEMQILEKAAKGSLKRQVFAYTSMLEEFRKPTGLQKQVAKATDLFATAYPLSSADCDKPDLVEPLLRHIGQEIHKSFGDNDFKGDRLDRQARLNAGLEISRRRYNKLFRHLMRMEAKLHTLVREIQKYEFTLIGKSALASRLSWEEFSRNRDTACFIAYLTARANLRSEFTIDGQQRAYDEIAHMLFQRCRANKRTNWWAIAHVFPEREVLLHLTEEQKGQMLGYWFQLLQEIAALLKETRERSDINLDTMVVKRGNDSTTWNNTANAWNKARTHWIALLHALEMDDALDIICPGKVLRLMAADVVAWHYRAGGALSPDTLVWRDIPLPWNVIEEKEACTRSQIQSVCERHGVDPAKTGWTGPYADRRAVVFHPTPELVHGVTVGSPFLARLLRDHGYFSGKPGKFRHLGTDASHGMI